jgi:hypothetical protein
MREIETRTSTMTDEREDITPEQWVDILGKEDNFLYTICRATAFGDVEMGLHRVGDGPAELTAGGMNGVCAATPTAVSDSR